MSLKSKGTNAERELIHLLWKQGIAASRVAGSGSTRYPSPDIIAGNIDRKLAIECKSIKGNYKYIPKEDIEQLKEFSQVFGCESWIGLRFSKSEWLFVSLEDLSETEKSFSINRETAKRKGILITELI